ncbi:MULTISPECIES: methyltransferase domain-containing protein [unclassified Flavobacterium]|uniref:methyltransferase domain-containing protein n=1 Tax=unclassified Flavobacterium TaxID=196869 RepID=UPI001570E19B|nr:MULTISPECIES: methyltransferase domain-containing protein [unclassified Flavobacterium]MBE0393226.1 Ubiquinone biosynthesis O-methyltransferase [Flavobacterium sp. PL002]NRT14879.1 2-polyprenyl-3-methyl-5-hydroxy-6-metoxy-1,4-benzoquinol methylase [Flavobacterium sp. 28A]
MGINTKFRTDQEEIMDDFALEGEVLRATLDKIAQINQFLGGNKLTLSGVKKLLKKIAENNIITIVDVGCGNGDMLRLLADYGKKNSLNFNLIGIDANNFTANHAKQLSESYSNISYRCEDVFETDFKNLKYDIVLCTLTLHHFKEEAIIELMSIFNQNATVGIVINDLQRSLVAYRLFQAVCYVFRLNDMSREDGLVSILRGFKKVELVAFSRKLKFKKYQISWKWAFRYQWIISKI